MKTPDTMKPNIGSIKTICSSQKVRAIKCNSSKPVIKGLLSLVIWFSLISSTHAQDRIVRGKVTSNEGGSQLMGVNILIEGTAIGTVSDLNGEYTLQFSAQASHLIFSFIGYKTLKMAIDQKSVINVALEIDVTQLNEVVITALGFEKDRDKVGSASTNISGQSIVKSGEPTLINGMSGKSSGLLIARTTGDPGSGSYIQIRGQSSINSSIQPLIVVDGVPVYNSTLAWGPNVAQQSRLNDINPNDIESTEVLKGASASALWGTRASNGVIMITTKKGNSQGNKVNISYSGTYSTEKILVKHPLQNKWGQGISGFYFTRVLSPGSGFPYSFGDKIANRPGGSDFVITNSGYFQTSVGNKIYPIVESDFTTSANGGKNSRETYDPYNAIFTNGHYYDQTITISGGDKDGNYYFSIGDLNQDGIIKKNSNYRRTSFRVNTEKQMNDWLRLSSNLMYTRVASDRIAQGSQINGLLLGALRTPPDWNNDLAYEGIYFSPSGSGTVNRQLSYRNQIGKNADPSYDNPVWVINNNKNRSELDRFVGSAQLDVLPFEWLTITLRGGVDHYSDNRNAYFPPGTSGLNNGGGFILQTARETQYNFDGFARGQFKLGNALRLSPLLGVNFNQRKYDMVGGYINSFVITTNPPLSLDNALAANDDPYNQFSQQRTSAAYATLDVDFRDQLFLELTGRAENSSVFSYEDNPIFFYPSASINWHLLKTLGIENKILSFAKLRAGYGEVATTPESYNTATYWSPSIFIEGWGPHLQASGSLYGGGYEQSSELGNKNLRPETKKEWEAGFDIRFLKDRISLGATYFSNKVNDLIINVPLAGSTGFSNQTANVAALQNQGFEIDFSADLFKPGPIRFKVYGNWTRIRNEVTDLEGVEALSLSGGLPAVVKGYPVSIFYGSVFEHNTEGGLVLDDLGFPKFGPSDEVIGNPNPDWRGGLGFILTWKGFSLNTLFEHSHGGSMYSWTRGALVTHGTHKDTDHEITISAADASLILNYSGNTVDTYGYLPNTDGSYTVRGYLHDFGGGQVLVDETWWTTLGGGFGGPNISWIETAQWTKLRELSLTYSLNSVAFRKASRLSSVDFSITGRNLWLWTGFKGNDPESSIGSPSNERGVEAFNNPATKSFLFTIKINY